ncbi:hypothetical protein Agub_g8027 [Astrephomene gubernaculifera]|uniref:Uncharacterized protein n=1 Tax=Astrephomene gubernaculifera TaxID=47775 RepID=A0AAD3DRC4_9CHLO|nr:hypothetical protein Agub_g8027 [Astrephomene gubernaculifera]
MGCGASKRGSAPLDIEQIKSTKLDVDAPAIPVAVLEKPVPEEVEAKGSIQPSAAVPADGSPNASSEAAKPTEEPGKGPPNDPSEPPDQDTTKPLAIAPDSRPAESSTNGIASPTATVDKSQPSTTNDDIVFNKLWSSPRRTLLPPINASSSNLGHLSEERLVRGAGEHVDRSGSSQRPQFVDIITTDDPPLPTWVFSSSRSLNRSFGVRRRGSDATSQASSLATAVSETPSRDQRLGSGGSPSSTAAVGDAYVEDHVDGLDLDSRDPVQHLGRGAMRRGVSTRTQRCSEDERSERGAAAAAGAGVLQRQGRGGGEGDEEEEAEGGRSGRWALGRKPPNAAAVQSSSMRGPDKSLSHKSSKRACVGFTLTDVAATGVSAAGSSIDGDGSSTAAGAACAVAAATPAAGSSTSTLNAAATTATTITTATISTAPNHAVKDGYETDWEDVDPDEHIEAERQARSSAPREVSVPVSAAWAEAKPQIMKRAVTTTEQRRNMLLLHQQPQQQHQGHHGHGHQQQEGGGERAAGGAGGGEGEGVGVGGSRWGGGGSSGGGGAQSSPARPVVGLPVSRTMMRHTERVMG